MFRLGDWQSRLSDYIVSCANTPFKYGKLDCGLFVAGAIRAMVDVDVVADIRGYKTRKQAFEAVKTMCGTATMEAVASHLADKFGFPEVPVLFAQVGDAVVLKHGRRSSLGIVAMHGTELLTPFKDGILRLPLALATRAFHIG